MTIGSHVFENNGHNYKMPARHYSTRRNDAVLFYGGAFSNFVGGPFELRDYNGIRYLTDDPVVAADDKVVAQSTHLRTYATVEHYFQANKAVTRKAHDYIADREGPWEAKRAGRSTELREDWEDVKIEVMLVALRVKFAKPPFFGALLGTHDRFIAEDSPTDAVWGARDSHGGWSGTNLLGEALMTIRAELRA